MELPRELLKKPALSDLLDEVANLYRRYVRFKDEAQRDAVALWTVHTYCFEQFEQSPILHITSPEARCGKTRLLDVAELVVSRHWRAITPSEAVVYRLIEEETPTLLLDEVDTIFRQGKGVNYEGLRALLNAGNRRGTTVPRCVGEGSKLKIKNFTIYCPKALAGIGKLPNTVADRSIVIELQRKKKDEPVEKFRYRDAKKEGEPLQERLATWASTVNLSSARPVMPPNLDDRCEDNWEGLLAIADAAGADWAQRARDSAVKLSIGRGEDDTSLGLKLLADCKTIFIEKNEERLRSNELLEALNALETSPWGEYLNGRPLTARGLARLLRRYNIKPTAHRFEGEVSKGYLKEDFRDAWERYLPSEMPVTPQNGILSVTPLHPSSEAEFERKHENQLEGKKEGMTCDVTVLPINSCSKGNGKNEADKYADIMSATYRAIAEYWRGREPIEPTGALIERIADLKERIDIATTGVVTHQEFKRLRDLYTNARTRRIDYAMRGGIGARGFL